VRDSDKVAMKMVDIRTLYSILVGAALGVLIEYVVNASLEEISINPMFSAAFGLCFIGLGGVILWRVVAPDTDQPERSTFLKVSTMVAALAVILAGLFCFCLDKYWFRSLSAHAKIPMYTLLGATVTYALCFSIVDMLNQGVCWCKCCREGEEAVTPLVSTPAQMWSLMAVGCISGAFYGCLFGYIDVEDDDEFHARFKEQEMFCIPLGLFLGGLAGYANDQYRHLEDIMFSAIPTQGGEWDFQDSVFEDDYDDSDRIDHCHSLMDPSP